MKKGVREVEGVVEGWNKERVDEGIDGDDEGEFKVISLRRTGFMSVSSYSFHILSRSRILSRTEQDPNVQ